MNCPKCGSSNVKVAETAPVSNAIFRRKKCSDCGSTIRTLETYLPDVPFLNEKYQEAMKNRSKGGY